MNTPPLTTERLILRKFTLDDLPAIFAIHSDVEVNRFLPWFPLTNMEETRAFFEERYASEYRLDSAYHYAVCLKEDNIPIGYVHIGTDDSHDLGYGLSKAFWHKGIITEASKAVVEQLKKDGIPYITATHDVNNPRSGGVMRQVGMTYRYSYVEHWMPKDKMVTYRMYQMSLDGKDHLFTRYWNQYDTHFIEEGV